ncbi:hypothetical protein [Mesorhizobium sp. IMUNJ 23232]|uniref:hypothetical protein n=1 Tax=Mesorhizobium sp. IMUNJ 23232 TaxID=3376064 RepID=UPI00379A4235
MSDLQAVEDEGGDTDDPSPDFWFNSWLACDGPLLATVVDRIATLYLEAQPRARRPKADQVHRVATVVSTIIANLYRFHRSTHKADRIAVPVEHAKSSRYEREGFRQVGPIIDCMAAQGFLIKHPAHFHKRRTGIVAKGDLLAALSNPEIRHADIKELEGREVLILKARMGRSERGKPLRSELVDYEDTAETKAMREEVMEINRFLSRQCIELHGERQANVTLSRRFLLRSFDAPHRFNLHGRLYGAFWVNLPKVDRAGLRINGEPIVDLDFASMFPRLAYIHLGLEPPEGDLYAIPGLEKHRAGAKAGLSALLSTRQEMRKLSSEVKEKLPPGWTARRLRDAVTMKHPALVPLFGADFALNLMFTESRIMVAALLSLARHRGIPALPMHDGMMVPAQREEEAREAMRKACLDVTGKEISVAVKL